MQTTRLLPAATTRRQALKRAALAAGAAAALGPSAVARAAPMPDRKRVLRVAQLSDIHVQPELKADEGMAACLNHLQEQKDKPELLITSGDSIMDGFAASADRTKLQWDLWKRVLSAECSLPVRSAIGNHDVWGWDQAKSRADQADPRFGKGWAVEALGLPERYYSVDQSGWHFVFLDSTQPAEPPGSYTARLDDAQFEWLEQDLGKTSVNTPVLVVSHIPIVSATPYFFGDDYSKSGNWQIPGAWIHTDALKLKDLFGRHPQVKLCLSGHMHLVDRVDYNGVTYLCNGAVSGNWWKGRHQECEAGYALIDLYDDGSFEHDYVEYGWVPRT